MWTNSTAVYLPMQVSWVGCGAASAFACANRRAIPNVECTSHKQNCEQGRNASACEAYELGVPHLCESSNKYAHRGLYVYPDGAIAVASAFVSLSELVVSFPVWGLPLATAKTGFIRAASCHTHTHPHTIKHTHAITYVISYAHM